MPLKHNSLASLFDDIADKIRALKGTTAQIKADDFPDELQGLPLPAEAVEFIERTAPHNGPAVLEKILGKSIIWRQLVKNGNFASNSNWAGSNCTLSIADNKLTVTRQAPSGTSAFFKQDACKAQNGHKVYISFFAKASTTMSLNPGFYYQNDSSFFKNITAGVLTRVSGIVQISSNGAAGYFRCYFSGNQDDSIEITNVCCIDLTDIYGAGNEPTTVAQFEADFPTYDPAYNAGEVQNNAATAIRAERVPIINIWDEEWELGNINNNGTLSNATDRIRSANFIPVLPNTAYYITKNGNCRIIGYGIDQTFTEAIADDGATGTGGYEFTTGPNTYYIKFRMLPAYGTTYNNDICINVSDPAINGHYYSHWRGSAELNLTSLTSGGTAIFPNGLAKIGTAQDAILYVVVANRQVGSRAYQAGDESDPDVITDGTTTYYALNTPEYLALDTPLTAQYDVQRGDKEIRESNNNCPYAGETQYKL